MRRLPAASILLLGLLAALAGSTAAARSTPASSPLGDWLTGRGGAVVRIFACAGGDGLCGRIVGLILDEGTPMPTDYRGRPQCGFELIRPSARHGRLWRGTIVDPRNGDRYHAQFHVAGSGVLALRGYIFLPIFGESRYWTRYRGAVPPSCRISRAETAATTTTGAGRPN